MITLYLLLLELLTEARQVVCVLITISMGRNKVWHNCLLLPQLPLYFQSSANWEKFDMIRVPLVIWQSFIPRDKLSYQVTFLHATCSQGISTWSVRFYTWSVRFYTWSVRFYTWAVRFYTWTVRFYTWAVRFYTWAVRFYTWAVRFYTWVVQVTPRYRLHSFPNPHVVVNVPTRNLNWSVTFIANLIKTILYYKFSLYTIWKYSFVSL